MLWTIPIFFAQCSSIDNPLFWNFETMTTWMENAHAPYPCQTLTVPKFHNLYMIEWESVHDQLVRKKNNRHSDLLQFVHLKFSNLKQCAGRFVDTINQDPSGSKSNQWHVGILRSTLLFWGVFPRSSKMVGNFPEPLAVSWRWTGWVWEITGWSSRLQENYW